jgi:hypothetical protein
VDLIFIIGDQPILGFGLPAFGCAFDPLQTFATFARRSSDQQLTAQLVAGLHITGFRLSLEIIEGPVSTAGHLKQAAEMLQMTSPVALLFGVSINPINQGTGSR